MVSFICFNNRLLFDKLSLKPYRIVHAKEWYRIISHGFVHADWVHLFVNMFTFWSFGKYIEETFRYLGFGEGAFLLLYFGGMVVASASDVIRYRNAAWYTSIGASGAVSAVLFTAIFLNPWDNCSLWPVQTARSKHKRSADQAYLEELKSVAGCYGYSPASVDRLLESGFSTDEMEEFLNEGTMYQ